MVKASRKWLKIILVLRIRKLGPAFIASKLSESLLFASFFNFSFFDFPDLNNFWDLAYFWFYNFSAFLACFILLPPNSSILLLPLFLPKASLLLLFLLEANLLLLFLLGVSLSSDPVVFNIEVSKAAILLKLWMNCW